MAGPGLAWQGRHHRTWRGEAAHGWEASYSERGVPGRGLAGQGMGGPGAAWRGEAGHGRHHSQGMEGPGVVRQGMVRHDPAGPGRARRG